VHFGFIISFLTVHFRWNGLYKFLSLPRRTLFYCKPYYHVTAFVRLYKNLSFYWVLRAGHSVISIFIHMPILHMTPKLKCFLVHHGVCLQVPIDQPCAAVQMIGYIVGQKQSELIDCHGNCNVLDGNCTLLYIVYSVSRNTFDSVVGWSIDSMLC
jgi:hypothetical protein